MNEIFVIMEIGQSNMVTRVYEQDPQAVRTLLGEGTAVIRNRDDFSSYGEALRESIGDAEQKARVDIQCVSVNVDDPATADEIADILRRTHFEVVLPC